MFYLKKKSVIFFHPSALKGAGITQMEAYPDFNARSGTKSVGKSKKGHQGTSHA